MKYFLVVFDRGHRRIERLEEYGDADLAVRDRFKLEAQALGPDVEVVVLGAEDREALPSTHSRYFDGTLLELAEPVG